MRSFSTLLAVVTLFFALALLGCEGPAGPQGADGADGSPVVQTAFSAYRSANLLIPEGDETTLAFDQVIIDEYDGYSSSSGVYTVQEAGDYHVSIGVHWVDAFLADEYIFYYFNLNGTHENGIYTTYEHDRYLPTHTFSRSFANLSAGDTLELEVFINLTGESRELYGDPDNQYTFITIDRLQ